MADKTRDLQLAEYLDIAKRRKLILVAAVALALLAALAMSALATPMYRASARVRVDVTASGDFFDDSTNVSASVRNRNLQNEVEFATSDRVGDKALESFDQIVFADIESSSESDSLIFSAADSDPDRAAEIANTFANAYVSERLGAAGERFLAPVDVLTDRLEEIRLERISVQEQIEAGDVAASLLIQLDSLDTTEAGLRAQLNQIDVLAQIQQGANVSILNEALAPDSPFEPSWVRNIGLALVLGLIAGAGLALLLETLDDTVVSKRDFERALEGVPVFAAVPEPFKGRRGRKVRKLVTSRSGAFTESFRTLRSAIELGQATGAEIRSILITSANPSEGKSTVAAHLAVSFARSGARVVVVDADMHNPTQHTFFGVENENGLAELLAKYGEGEIVTETASGEGLVQILPAGFSASSPAELLSSSAAPEMLEKLTADFDLVIVDSPPLRPVADTLPLARIVDATVLVAMANQTHETEIDQALELLARAQTTPLGAVLSGVDQDAGGYGYGYGYGATK